MNCLVYRNRQAELCWWTKAYYSHIVYVSLLKYVGILIFCWNFHIATYSKYKKLECPFGMKINKYPSVKQGNYNVERCHCIILISCTFVAVTKFGSKYLCYQSLLILQYHSIVIEVASCCGIPLARLVMYVCLSSCSKVWYWHYMTSVGGVSIPFKK